MKVEVFFQQLCTRDCCQNGHDFSQTRAIVETNNLDSNSVRRINIGRLIVFFRVLKIECDCQVVSKFNPFQDLTCAQNWNYVVSSDNRLADIDGDFYALFLGKRLRHEYLIVPERTREEVQKC